MNAITEDQRDKLVSDLKNVILDAEELLKITASDAGVEAVALRERVRERLAQAKHGLLDLQENTLAKAKAATRKADDYVHDHPWPSVAVAAGVGLLVGLLIGRR